MKISQALTDVIAERQRQVTGEHWDSAHDDTHAPGTLAQAGVVYANSGLRELSEYFIGPRWDAETARKWHWPWDDEWWKPKGPRRDLVRAAALIVAEIERLDRVEARKP